MRDPLDLKDARGYRSKYINSLNDAVKQTRIIGGDVEAVETEAGTFLYAEGEARQGRFRLFGGIAPIDGEAYNVRAVSDGCFFASGQFVKLKNAVGTYYAPGGLIPRGSGWYSDLAPSSSWRRCEVIIFSYNGEYYLGFRYDRAELYTLVEGGTSAIEDAIKILVTVGEFSASEDRVIQYVSSDIYYGGEGGAPVVIEHEPWEILSTEENGALVWWVVRPEWVLPAPYDIYPTGAVIPAPEAAVSWENLFPAGLSQEIDGAQCWRLTDVVSGSTPDNIERLYALLDANGQPQLLGVPSGTAVNESPACILLGVFSVNMAEFTQVRKGVFHSMWEETEPFFVEGNCDSSITRYSAAPVGLAEGTQMTKHSFWRMSTYLNGIILARAEQLNYSPSVPAYRYPQTALYYGNYIWRYNLHFREGDNTLIRDTQTTAVLNVETNLFASIIETPYVERINVVYPDTPLDQGSVDAVGGIVKVLAVEAVQDTTVHLYNTESISTTEGGIIEVAQ